MIPYGRQDIQQVDIDAILDVLRSDFLTQGPCIPAFETKLAAHVGARHAVAVNSATSALHMACLALGLGAGDLLWTSPITFVASANVALFCGADVDFVDIDPETFNMCTAALSVKLANAKATGRLPKIVMPVAMCGQSCDMEAIRTLADEYGFKILEDASHAIGGRYQGKFIGDGRYADISVFSFHPVKIITTGEGGMAVTNHSELASKMELLRSHGVTRNSDFFIGESHGPWYYQQIDLGFNYRLTDIQAALGISQLDRLDDYVTARVKRAAEFDQALSDLPLDLPHQRSNTASSWHLYVIRVKQPVHRLNLYNELRKDGIGVNIHYIPVHTHPYYQSLGFREGDFPISEDYYSRAISIPLYATITDEQHTKVITTLEKHLK